MLSKTPTVLLQWVWPLPRSLATTYGISVDFSSSPYLDVSVQAVPLIRLWIQRMMTRLSSCRIAPFGNLRIYRSLTAPRSLSQLVTSFIGSRCQGIPLVLFVAWPCFEISLVLSLSNLKITFQIIGIVFTILFTHQKLQYSYLTSKN